MKKYLLVVSFLVAVLFISPNISLAQTRTFGGSDSSAQTRTFGSSSGSSVPGASDVISTTEAQAKIDALKEKIKQLSTQIIQEQMKMITGGGGLVSSLVVARFKAELAATVDKIKQLQAQISQPQFQTPQVSQQQSQPSVDEQIATLQAKIKELQSVLGNPQMRDIILNQIGALQNKIKELQSQISQQQSSQQVFQQQPQSVNIPSWFQLQPKQWCYDFKYNLNSQSRGKEVLQLQTALEKEGFEIEQSEKINQIFGESTADAVVGFQQKYKDEILNPYNLKYGTGFVGKSTRAKLNSLYGCGAISPTPTPIPVPVPTPTNQPPVISGVSGPTTLAVNQTGTWEVKASDPEQKTLTYAVDWGDGSGGDGGLSPFAITPYIQTTTFTHSYSKTGIYYPTFTVTDNQGLSAKTSISVNVGTATTNTPPVIIGIPAIPISVVAGQSVSFSYSATDADNDDLSWSVVSWGDGTGQAGVCSISPVPNKHDKQGWTFTPSYAWSKPGNYNVIINVSDCKGGISTHTFNITISSTTTPSITVLSPNGGENLSKGGQWTISWKPVGFSSNASAYIQLYDSSNPPKFVRDIIKPVVMNNGYYTWTIPSDIPDGKYLVRIYDAAGIVASDTSDTPFNIVAATTTQISCTDSDGGKDYYTKGKATGLIPSVYTPGREKGVIWGEDSNKWSYRIDESLDYSIMYDACINSTTVAEGFCADNKLYSLGYVCPSGCSNGVCLSAGVGQSSSINQMSSILRSAEKILAEMLKSLAR